MVSPDSLSRLEDPADNWKAQSISWQDDQSRHFDDVSSCLSYLATTITDVSQPIINSRPNGQKVRDILK